MIRKDLTQLDMPAETLRQLGSDFLDLAVQWLAEEPNAPVLLHRSGIELAALPDLGIDCPVRFSPVPA